MTSHVLLVGGMAEFDQFAPIVWALDKHGESVHLLADESLLSRGDPRETLLRSLKNVTIHSFRMPSSRIAQRAWSARKVRKLLTLLDAGLVGVEWGNGIAYRDLSRGKLRRLKDRFATTPSIQLQLVAREMGIHVVSLPHGHSTKTTLVPSEHIREVAAAHEGKLPFADRDSFAAYVFASDYHRRVIVENSTMSGENAQVWGSVRFSREWIDVLYALSSAASIDSGTRRRVLVFLPKWHNGVDRAQTNALLRALGSTPGLHVVVAGHIRARDTALTEDEIAELNTFDSLQFAGSEWSSIQLIGWCEVLIDVDSSIAFDAIRLGKVYVRPKYLQSDAVKTIYDLEGGAHQPLNLSSALAMITASTLTPAPVSPSFWPIVAGDGDRSVADRYAENLKRLRAG
jgi:hypothetical protein